MAKISKMYVCMSVLWAKLEMVVIMVDAPGKLWQRFHIFGEW
jgi:hypothetical protein